MPPAIQLYFVQILYQEINHKKRCSKFFQEFQNRDYFLYIFLYKSKIKRTDFQAAVNLKISRGILDNGHNSKNPREREYKPDMRDAGRDKGEWKDSCPGGNAVRRGCAN